MPTSLKRKAVWHGYRLPYQASGIFSANHDGNNPLPWSKNSANYIYGQTFMIMFLAAFNTNLYYFLANIRDTEGN